MFDNSQLNEVDVIQPAKRNSPDFPAVLNIEFIKMEKKDTDKYKSVIFTFKNEKGAILKDTVFEPRQGERQTDEAFKTVKQLVHSHLGHISRAYLSEVEHKAIQGKTWDEYVKSMAVALGIDPATNVPTRARGVLAKAKIVFRETKGKYYSSFPGVPPFLSTPNHPKDFTIDPNYDLFEIPEVKPDNEKPSNVQGFGAQPAETKQATQEAPKPNPIGW